MANVRIWKQYCAQYGLQRGSIRPGCEPRVILHADPRQNAIVLVHGLTDSPYFMLAIGKYLHRTMGFDVYIPLLAGHGLLQPRGMEGVTADAWIENVDRAIEQATLRRPDVVLSMGGLSMGGVICLHRARFHPQHRVTGFVAPFAAPVGLAGKMGDKEGDLKAALLRMGPLVEIADGIKDWRSLIGDNPYRYARMDVGAAQQLVKLIDEVNQDMAAAPPTQPIFAAHSECDEAASIEAMRAFLNHCLVKKLFPIGLEHDLPHASIVLAKDIKDSADNVLEEKNPEFANMMDAMHGFATLYLGI